MRQELPTSDEPQAPTSQQRRKFLKVALAGTFAAPMVTSMAVDHLTSRALAQQAYVAPVLVSWTRQTQGPPNTNATYIAGFSLPIDTSSYRCWIGRVRNLDNPVCSGDPSFLWSFSSYNWVTNTSLVINGIDETIAGMENDYVTVSMSVNYPVMTCTQNNQLLLGTNGVAVDGSVALCLSIPTT